ncbi:MAG: bifunctional hydroxymethylpyrimidine kinase/phosphomethylpyrimidine kinase [Oscillospiraceae bacterium]|nr:MAG: bifunctional hydroxymethylpyrimidine kinase/phosphomethylpyrimidine kinase [Oscillospiraceae bacterium]
MKKVLTIAGSDCSGGAGIQADLKTMTAHGVYGMSVITALTAQNTTGVYGVQEATPEFVGQQLDCVFQDIRPDAVKIGMVSNAAIIRVIAQKLRDYHAENIVVDPVMVATSGSRLMQDEAVSTLREQLLPLACVITPNIPEAECLCGISIESTDGMLQAARQIAGQIPGAVLVKGGHLTDTADDLLYHDGQAHWYHAPRVNNPNTHGTGCTLSSAIACQLAFGLPLPEAVRLAKKYITGALSSGLNLGKGSGPLNHCFAIGEGR